MRVGGLRPQRPRGAQLCAGAAGAIVMGALLAGAVVVVLTGASVSCGGLCEALECVPSGLWEDCGAFRCAAPGACEDD